MQKLRKKKLNTMPNSFQNTPEILYQSNLFPIQGEKVVNAKNPRPQSHKNSSIVTKGFPHRKTSKKFKTASYIKNKTEDSNPKICHLNQRERQRSDTVQAKYMKYSFENGKLEKARNYHRYSPTNRCVKMITFNGGFRNLSKYSKKFIKSTHERIDGEEDNNIKNLNVEGIKFHAPKNCEHFESCLKNSIMTVDSLKQLKQSSNFHSEANTPVLKQKNEFQFDDRLKYFPQNGADLCINSIQIDKVAFGKQNYSLHVVKRAQQNKGKQKELIQKYSIKKRSNKSFLNKCDISNIVQKENRPHSGSPLSFSNFVGNTN